MLCLADDLHWADQPSLGALSFAARRLTAEPVMLLGSSRVPLGVTGLPERRLGGLDETEAAEFLDQRAPLAAAVRDTLVRAADGNPLALTEPPDGLTAAQITGTVPLPDRVDRLPARDDLTGLRLRYLRGLIELRSGVPGDGLAILLPAAADALAADQPLAVAMLTAAGECAFQAGDADGARDAALMLAKLPDEGERLTAVARARTLGAAGTLAWALRSLTMDELIYGRYAWAEAYASEGLELATETGQPNLACQHQALLAQVAGFRGDAESVRSLTGHVLTEAAERGLRGTAALARLALVNLDLATGRPEDALGHLESLSSTATLRGVASHAIPDLVEAAVRAGQPSLAAERLPGYLAWAQAADTRALAARCRALLASGDEADELYAEALRWHARSDRPLEMARTALLFGEHLRRVRRRVSAREQLRSALEGFTTLGAAAELRATGETVRPSSSGDPLTAQELQVARQVSEGLTNRDVAAQLFISPRTVDHHLRNVYRKLGISSRTELARLQL